MPLQFASVGLVSHVHAPAQPLSRWHRIEPPVPSLILNATISPSGVAVSVVPVASFNAVGLVALKVP